MSQKIMFAFGILLVALMVLSCNNSNNTIVSPSVPVELISNSSFESNDVFTLQGWSAWRRDVIDSALDAPQSGGKYSVSIEDMGIPIFGYITTTVAAPSGVHIYKFSVWTKSNFAFSAGSSAELLLKSVDTTFTVNVFQVIDTVWTFNSKTDTLNATSNDSLVIRLRGGTSNFIRRTMFNLVKLEVIK